MQLRAALLPSSVDKISSQEIKFERRRWFRHKSDDANPIRMTAVTLEKPIEVLVKNTFHPWGEPRDHESTENSQSQTA